MKTPEQLQCRYEMHDMRMGCGEEEELEKVALEQIGGDLRMEPEV